MRSRINRGHPALSEQLSQSPSAAEQSTGQTTRATRAALAYTVHGIAFTENHGDATCDQKVAMICPRLAATVISESRCRVKVSPRKPER
jgi:hypothetical protein